MRTMILFALSFLLGAMVLPAAAQEAEAPEIVSDAPRLVSYRNGDAAVRFQNYEVALQLYADECEDGELSSCKSLGDMYRRGWGTDQDYQIADEIYVETCDLGESTACLELANLLFEGRGLAQNYSRARGLYDQACDLGNPRGCAVLGNMMYVALGGPRDRDTGAQLMREACAEEVEYACNQVQRYGIDRGNARFFNPWGGN